MLDGVEKHEGWEHVPREKQQVRICFGIRGKYHFKKVRIWWGSGALHKWTAADFLERAE